MFTPHDMTPNERALLATVTEQMIRARGAVTEAEVAAATSEAEQTAAEMIWAQRAELTPPGPGPLEDNDDPYLAWYYEGLQLGAETSRIPAGDPDQATGGELPAD